MDATMDRVAPEAPAHAPAAVVGAGGEGDSGESAAGHNPGGWRPRRGTRDRAEDVVWLPRLIDKGRRALAGEAAGRDLLGGYHFGANDAADAQLLRFLRLTHDGVLGVLRRESDDAMAA